MFNKILKTNIIKPKFEYKMLVIKILKTEINVAKMYPILVIKKLFKNLNNKLMTKYGFKMFSILSDWYMKNANHTDKNYIDICKNCIYISAFKHIKNV